MDGDMANKAYTLFLVPMNLLIGATRAIDSRNIIIPNTTVIFLNLCKTYFLSLPSYYDKRIEVAFGNPTDEKTKTTP